MSNNATHIVFPLFNGMTPLDFVAPYQAFSLVPGARVTAASLGGRDIEGAGLVFGHLDDLAKIESCDVICVPGGFGTAVAMLDEGFMREVRRLAGVAEYHTSVCTGALILGAAGLLRGKRAATYWASRDTLALFGATVEKARVSRDGNIITGGGVTAGLDFALAAIAEIFGRATAEDVQLRLEYAPAPPFGIVHPDDAPAEVTARLRKEMNAGLTADRASAEQAARRLQEVAPPPESKPRSRIMATNATPQVARRYGIIEAPSILGLRSAGVERLPERLLERDLAKSLSARVVARVEALPQKPGRDPETQTLNGPAIAAWSPRLADAVEGVINRGEFPLILGGDCSILLGSMLALKRRGRFGLLYVDGHADFYQPEAEPTGEAASMDLGFATGYGPELLTNIEGRRPLVRAEDTVLFGYRDAELQRECGSQSPPPELLAVDLATVRSMGLEHAMRTAIERVTRTELDGFFIHFDADALHDDIMPAVDYRTADGLSAIEATFVLQAALASGRAVGLEVTVYNPALDPDGAAGRELTDILCAALAR